MSQRPHGDEKAERNKLEALRVKYEQSVADCERSHPAPSDGVSKVPTAGSNTKNSVGADVASETQERCIAVERIQLHWRRFQVEQQRQEKLRELIEDEEFESRQCGGGSGVPPAATSSTPPSASPLGGEPSVSGSANDEAARRIQQTWKVRYMRRARKVAAAQRIQRLWRQYSDAVDNYDDTASTAGSAADLAEAAERIQQIWRRYRKAMSHSQDRPSNDQDGSDEDEDLIAETQQVLAAGRIQTLWRRYRTAVVAASMVNSSQPSTREQASAANTIQEAWRHYQQALGSDPDVESGVAPAPPLLQGPGAHGHSQTQSQGTNASPVEEAEAALFLQEEIDTLSQMFDAVDEMELAGSDILGGGEDDEHTETTRGASLASTGRALGLDIDGDDNDDAVSLASQILLGRSDEVAEGGMGSNDAAAQAIQRLWRGRFSRQQHPGREPVVAVSEDGAAPEAADANEEAAPQPRASSRFTQDPNTLDALMTLQRRFRFNRLLNMVVQRERNDAAIRLQDEWRRRQAIRNHRRLLEQGRQDAAASIIQRFSRTVQLRREHVDGAKESQQYCCTDVGVQTQSTGPLSPLPQGARRSPPQPAGTSASGDGVLSCIVCLDTPVQIALLPCGHAMFCGECASRLRRCPNCRQTVAMRIRIFL